jgi:hypothetical protein
VGWQALGQTSERLGWIRKQRADSVSIFADQPAVPDALDGVVVKHVSGGTSTLGFKSYDQGRTRWQATTRSIANVGRFDTRAVTRSSVRAHRVNDFNVLSTLLL